MDKMKMFDGSSDTNNGGEINKMKYQYMKLNNGMNITHSQTYRFNGLKCVDVYFEIPSESNCFNSCCISLPSLTIKENTGFTEKEIEELKAFAKHDASAFFEFGDEDGDELA